MNAYQVRIAHTPYQFTVLENETVLAAALRQNIPMPWGCAGGICGVCMGSILRGTIEYVKGAPLALFEEDAAEGKALFCCAHPRSDLLLLVPELGSDYQS
jgi:ferredoxin